VVFGFLVCALRVDRCVECEFCRPDQERRVVRALSLLDEDLRCMRAGAFGFAAQAVK
jgi:hypothetical protein